MSRKLPPINAVVIDRWIQAASHFRFGVLLFINSLKYLVQEFARGPKVHNVGIRFLFRRRTPVPEFETRIRSLALVSV